MDWSIVRYEGFLEDILDLRNSDASLGEEIIRQAEKIEANPHKGEQKPGGPIRGFRADYVRNQSYAVVYNNEPDTFNLNDIERVEFYGVTKHEKQAKAVTGVGDPLVEMKTYELRVPGDICRRIESSLRSTNLIYVSDIDWGTPTKICGEYEVSSEFAFESIVSECEILQRSPKTLRQVLEDF